MPVVAFIDAQEFDASKSYFHKMRTKEEVSYLILRNYNNEPLNDMVKGVIVSNDDVLGYRPDVLYIKELNHVDSGLDLQSFVEENVDATDILTYVIKLHSDFNDLRLLMEIGNKYSTDKIRFIGGNLLALEGVAVGYFPESFISANKLKMKASVRYDFSRVKIVETSALVTRDYDEFLKRKSQVKKSKVQSTTKTSSSNKGKKSRKKRSVAEIMNSL